MWPQRLGCMVVFKRGKYLTLSWHFSLFVFCFLSSFSDHCLSFCHLGEICKEKKIALGCMRKNERNGFCEIGRENTGDVMSQISHVLFRSCSKTVALQINRAFWWEGRDITGYTVCLMGLTAALKFNTIPHIPSNCGRVVFRGRETYTQTLNLAQCHSLVMLASAFLWQWENNYVTQESF